MDEVLNLRAEDIEILSPTSISITLSSRKTNPFGGKGYLLWVWDALISNAIPQGLNPMSSISLTTKKDTFALSAH
jgi:hypothetical protein